MTTHVLEPLRETQESPPAIAPSVVAAIDCALIDIAARELLAGSEVVDLLLDLRLIVAADGIVAEADHPTF